MSGWFRFSSVDQFVVVPNHVHGGNNAGTHKGCPYGLDCQRSLAVSRRYLLTAVVEDEAVVFGQVDVEEE